MLNKYKVMWGGSPIGSKTMMDGYATIEGETFEEAREAFFQKSLKNGMRIGFCSEWSITFYDLETGETIDGYEPNNNK